MTNAAFADSPTLNMVQSQIAPNGVTNEAVLDAFLALDRMEYVPTQLRARACADDNVLDDTGRLLMLRPQHIALLAQTLVNQPGRGSVAVIGDPTGYVVDLLNMLGFAALPVADETALQAGQPWQAVLLHGAVADLPEFLFSYLQEGGLVLGIVQPRFSPIGDLVAALTPAGRTIVGQAAAPYIAGFEPREGLAL